jgi:hypothetical protein
VINTLAEHSEVKMIIPDPVANHGDKVMVHNYRSKPNDGSQVWEEGTVRALSYGTRYGKDKFSWSYEVVLERESAKGNGIWLYIGDDRIAKHTGQPPFQPGVQADCCTESEDGKHHFHDVPVCCLCGYQL